MYNLFPFALGVIFVVINGLTQLAFAQSQGFKLKPTGLAFIVAAGASLILGSVTPISGQSAMIALAGRTDEERQRVTALLIAAVASTILGLAGAISIVVDFAGLAVMAGMMAGVGIMLAQVGVDFIIDKKKGDMKVGFISLISAVIIFGLFSGSPHRLVYTVAGSVAISTIFYLFVQGKRVEMDAPSEDSQIKPESENGKFWTKEYWTTSGDWKLIKPLVTPRAVLSALALICLGIGITTSFGTVNQNMARGQGLEVTQNMDTLMFTTGLVDFVGVIFGGMPLEPIISGTAAAPWPVLGAFAVMLVLGLLCLLGLVTKICRYMPVQSIAGFLVVIGFYSTFLVNIRNPNFVYNIAAEGADPMFRAHPAAAIAMGVTALTKNPFLGLLAGILVRYIGSFFGIFI